MSAVKPMPRRFGAGGCMSLTDRGEDGGDGLIVGGEFFIDAHLEFVNSAGQFLVGAEYLAQLHEGTYDVDAHPFVLYAAFPRAPSRRAVGILQKAVRFGY